MELDKFLGDDPMPRTQGSEVPWEQFGDPCLLVADGLSIYCNIFYSVLILYNRLS